MPVILKIKYQEDTRRITLEKVPSFIELIGSLNQLFPNLIAPFSVKYVDEDEDLVTISSDMELAEAFRIASTNNVMRLFLTPKLTPSEARSTNTDPTTGLPNVNDFASKLLQMFGGLSQDQQQSSQPTQASIADLASLFQSMGLNNSSSASAQSPQHTSHQPLQIEQFVQQLLATPAIQQLIPQLLPLLTQLFPLVSHLSSAHITPRSDNQGPAVHDGIICDSCEGAIYGTRYKCLNCANYDLCERCKVKPDIHDPTHNFNAMGRPQERSSMGRGCPYIRRDLHNSWAHHHSRHRKTAQQNGFLARFVTDVTVPDGISMAPGQKFVKIWRLRNEGQVAWAEGTCLEYVGGDKLFLTESVPVPVTSPGEEIDVAVDMTAPLKPGRYVSFWKLCHVDGSRFGQRVWVDIHVGSVEEKNPPTGTSQTQSTQTTVAHSMEIETQTQASAVNKATNTTVTSSTVGTNTSDVSPFPASPISAEVQQLIDMGFSDVERIQRLLDQNNNDMVKTVQSLLS